MERLNVFNYTLNSAETRLDVYIDGMILDAETQQIYQDWFGDDTSVSFKSLRDKVNGSGMKNIKFWVNSYGGHVGDSMAIHDWIQSMDNDAAYTIETCGLGMICSAATYIVSAAKNSTISKNSWYMIHNVSGGIYGDVELIENYAQTMRKFNDTIVAFYVNLTGKTTEEVTKWMSDETWFTGTEAVENGFVNSIMGGEESFSNSIAAELFPYKNKAALNLYNSFVKPKDDDQDILNLNTDMNKLTAAIVNALKEAGLVGNSKGGDAKPITEEGLTNALNSAFKEINIKDMVNECLTEMFKDGAPEGIQNTIASVVTNTMTEKAKDFTPTEDFNNLKTEVETIKSDFENKIGGAAPDKSGQGNNADDNDRYNHAGISWGTPAK